MIRLPIQPFDSTLRDEVRRAIYEAFEQTYQLHGCDYDPDTCGEAADRVIALLAGKFLGVHVEVAPQDVIGLGTLSIDPTRAP